MARIAGTPFGGFAISADHPLGCSLTPDSVDVKVITSRQFQQYPEYNTVLEEITAVVREHLAVRHAYTFQQRLDQILLPPGGHGVSNGRAELPNVRLAQSVDVAALP